MNNSQDSQENSEVRRNAQIEITAIDMIYNNEHEINARGFRKDFLIANKINPEKEICIPASDSGENEVVVLPQSISNAIKANRNRRMTDKAIKDRMKKQRIDNSMQK